MGGIYHLLNDASTPAQPSLFSAVEMTCCSDAVRHEIFFQLDMLWIPLQESQSTKHIFIDFSNTFDKSYFLSYISAQKTAAKLISNYHYLRLKCVLSDTNLCQKTTISG